jgi:hypothetical protein
MLAIVIALFQAGGWSHQEPPSLLTMEEGRAGWSQIEVEWSYTTQRDGRQIFYANRYAEGEWIGTDLGDGTGLAPPDQNGQRMRKFPLHRLFTADGTVWQHEENSPHAVLRALGTPTLHKTEVVAGGGAGISRRISVVCGRATGVGESHVE